MRDLVSDARAGLWEPRATAASLSAEVGAVLLGRGPCFMVRVMSLA